MSVLTDTAPKRIYLCVSDDEEDLDLPYPEIYQDDEPITWSTDSQVACTVEYVRADLHAALYSLCYEYRAEMEILRAHAGKEAFCPRCGGVFMLCNDNQWELKSKTI